MPLKPPKLPSDATSDVAAGSTAWLCWRLTVLCWSSEAASGVCCWLYAGCAAGASEVAGASETLLTLLLGASSYFRLCWGVSAAGVVSTSEL